jgi:mono/diheme cytochrome c family protein
MHRETSLPQQHNTPRLALAVFALAAASGSALLSCSDNGPTFTEGVTFGDGTRIRAARLNEGHDAYMHNCRPCHGDKGDGRGMSAPGLRPPPRDFTKAQFKFAWVDPPTSLPTDDDLKRIVKGGLHGTAMLAWDVTEEELKGIIQYIKTFPSQANKAAGKAKDDNPWLQKDSFGEQVKPTPDPWVGKEAEAFEAGKLIYHTGGCNNCHPNYVTEEEYVGLWHKYDADIPITSFRDNMYLSVLQEPTTFEVEGVKMRILPPDFLRDAVRSIPRNEEELKPLERIGFYYTPLQYLYLRINAGVNPVMTSWKAYAEDKKWAVAHYVMTLIQMRGTHEADSLRHKLETQVHMKLAPSP